MSTVEEHTTTRRRVSASSKAKSEPKQSENTPNINARDVKQAYQVPPGITTIQQDRPLEFVQRKPDTKAPINSLLKI